MGFESLEIVYEDHSLLVVNKPAGLASMGVRAPTPSLLAIAKTYLARTGDRLDPFVAIHGRLDFHVAGLVLIAKDAEAADQLRQQQEQGRIEKTYHALVAGRLDQPSGELANWLLKSKRHRSVSIVDRQIEGAQLAKSHFRRLQHNDHNSLLSINLLTGRKHQIRAQLSHLGHPILGDRKYGSTESFPTGIALFCKRIRLTHPETQQTVDWEIEYPQSWSDALGRVS